MPGPKSQARLGTYVTSSVSGENVRAYIPPPLPPVPELKLEGLHQHLDRANQLAKLIIDLLSLDVGDRLEPGRQLHVRHQPQHRRRHPDGHELSMRGKQVLMESLIAHGVEYIFGNPGTTESPILDALLDYPQLHYIVALHERRHQSQIQDLLRLPQFSKVA